MRHIITLLIAGCISSTALAFQPRSGAVAAGKACSLLSRELAMKVSTGEGRKALEHAKPIEGTEDMSVARGASACSYGHILLILDPFGQPEKVRNDMGTPTAVYKDYERVSGVGDVAFFRARSNADLRVWTGSRHFAIEMSPALFSGEDPKALKANVIALANAIIPQLR
jgi:hypothetical protein